LVDRGQQSDEPREGVPVADSIAVAAGALNQRRTLNPTTQTPTFLYHGKTGGQSVGNPPGGEGLGGEKRG